MGPPTTRSANWRLIALLGGLAVFTLTLSGVETASGAPRPFALKYESSVGVLPNDENAHEDSLLCPRRTKVLGGGVFTLGGDPVEDVEVTSTFPDDLVPEAGSQPDDGWIGGAVNSSDTAAQMGVDAICGRSVNPKYRSATIALPTGGGAGKTVRCPAKTHVTGGGVFTTGNDKDLEVASTFPMDSGDRGVKPDDGWIGRATNDSGTDQVMTVFAVCAKLPGLVYRQHTTSLPPQSNSASTLDTIKCRRGTRVVGGGIDLHLGVFSLDLEVGSTFAADGADRDHLGDDGWAGAANNDALTAGAMKVFAICKRPNPSP